MIQSRRVKWAERAEIEVFFRNLKGRPTGKKLLGKPRNRWEDNNIKDLRE
jgi:hypothetical protein